MGSLGSVYDKHIDLQLGWPTPSLFPAKALAAASQALLSDPNVAAQALVYGPDPGHETLRAATADWLTRFYHPAAGAINSERLFISNGASGALSMLLAMFTDPAVTRYIWMIEPTYFLACPTFEDAGFEGCLRGVPEDEEGLDFEFLRDGLLKAEKEDILKGATYHASGRYSKLYKHVIYLVPTFSNPSAKIMSVRRRTQLVQLAREFDALIIADDVYDWLRWPAPSSGKDEIPSLPPPRLVDIDRSLLGGSVWGNAISNGSFSKIVAPGMRVGWVEGSVLHVEDLCKTGPVRSGGNQGHFASMLISQLLIVGALEEHIHTTLIPTYRQRHRVLVKSVEKYLVPLGVSVSATGVNTSDDLLVSGGFFLYIDFPNDSPSSEVIAKISLEEYNLRIAPGGLMTIAGDDSSVTRAKRSFGRGARLCWAWHEENEIYEGVQRLASAYQTALRRM